MNLQITDRVTLAYKAASIYFVKQSMMTKMNPYPLEAFRVIGLITSMPHIKKGHIGAVDAHFVRATLSLVIVFIESLIYLISN